MTKIPKFRLVPEPLSEEAKNLQKFKLADDKVGNRHQLGGEPQFLQNNDIPFCPECEEPMTFYGQLDSINDDH